MPYKCPNCSKGPFASTASLNRHLAKYHATPETNPIADPPASSGTDPAQAADPPAQGQALNIKAPPETPDYYCVDCGHKGIKKGQPICPNCGGGFAWDKVK